VVLGTGLMLLNFVNLVTDFAAIALTLARLRISPTLYVPVVASGSRYPQSGINHSKTEFAE